MLDDFFGPEELQSLLKSLTGSHSRHKSADPNQAKWERNTADDAHGTKTWGLKAEILHELDADPTSAMVEIQSRLVSMLSLLRDSELQFPIQDIRSAVTEYRTIYLAIEKEMVSYKLKRM